jgi:hypothetical protein
MGNTSAIDPSSLPAKGENVSVAKADESKMAASAAKQPSETEKSPPNVVKPKMPSGVSAGVASQPGGSGPASSQRKGSKPCHKCGSPNRSWYRTLPSCRWEQQAPGSCKYREKCWFAHQGPKLSKSQKRRKQRADARRRARAAAAASAPAPRPSVPPSADPARPPRNSAPKKADTAEGTPATRPPAPPSADTAEGPQSNARTPRLSVPKIADTTEGASANVRAPRRPAPKYADTAMGSPAKAAKQRLHSS